MMPASITMGTTTNGLTIAAITVVFGDDFLSPSICGPVSGVSRDAVVDGETSAKLDVVSRCKQHFVLQYN